MKNTICIIACLLVVIFLCSCQKSNEYDNTSLVDSNSFESNSIEEKQEKNIYTDTSAYEYEEISGGIAITHFTNDNQIEYEKIIIPSEIDGKVVIGIGIEDESRRVMGAVFGKCEVVIPNTVTYIASRAFEGARGLVKLSGGQNCKVISEAAFANCSNLVEVTFLDGVTELAGNAFAGCTAWYENHS